MNKRVLYIVPGLLVLGVDRLVKMLAQSTFPHVLIPGVLAVVPAQNTGMALGLFQNHSYLILIVSVLLVLFSIRLLRRIRPGGLAAASISMIAGGALGNMIDRLAYGYVIDMFKPLFMDFYIFNIADVGVVVGAVLCAVSLRFRPQDWSEA
ncbi:MAG: signal peptidase II [Clostridia bacterium]|nr:signal peptidase II [Clostridia bacterium]MBR0407657.1 signal peptidase II [Clostridia bacterium]